MSDEGSKDSGFSPVPQHLKPENWKKLDINPNKSPVIGWKPLFSPPHESSQDENQQLITQLLSTEGLKGNIDSVLLSNTVEAILYMDSQRYIAVIPSRDAHVTAEAEDRGRLIQHGDTTIFFGADGVSQSFFGGQAADQVVHAASNAIFQNPHNEFFRIGQDLKTYQTILEKNKKNLIPPQSSQMLRDVLEEKLYNSGSQTTLFGVKINSDGALQYVGLGDGIAFIVRADHTVQMIADVTIGGSAGRLSTKEGVKNPDAIFSIQEKLLPGDRLIVGTDGLAEVQNELLQHLHSGQSIQTFPIRQGNDDITIFAYTQQKS